jgi:trehalose-phosphatase
MRLIDIFQLVKSGAYQSYFDFDGTLAPFTSNPADARPQGDIALHLAALDKELRAQGFTGILFVTGRQCSEMGTLLGNKLPVRGGFEHGAKLVLDQRALSCSLTESQTRHLNEVYESASKYCSILSSRYPGFDFTQLIERKTYSLALHWRALEAANLPGVDVLEISKKFHQLLSENQNRSQEFKVLDGDMNYELHLNIIDKGKIINQLSKIINKPNQRPVFFGDDFVGTDGSAANAVWALGGFVVMVDNGKGRVDNFLTNHPKAASLKEGVDYLILRGPEPQKQIDGALKQVFAPTAVEKPYVILQQSNQGANAFTLTSYSVENPPLSLNAL